MLTKLRWEHLIPHRGAMCLLDSVVAWNNSSIHASAVSHRAMNNPLRSDGVLRGINLCEYSAQAMAIHGGLHAQRDGRVGAPGMLVSLRDVKLHVTRIDDLAHALDVYAERLLDGGASWQYTFRVEHAGRVLAEGRAAIVRRGTTAAD